jgi:protein ImuB
MRFGCLFVPDLPLQALLRVEPDLHGRPVAVAQGEGASARVVAVSVPARTQGVLPGARLKEALALCPDLVLRWDDEAVREAAREAVLDAAAAVSPRVEEVAPGLVLVDARGLEKLHGGDRGLASALLVAARKVGLEGRAGVASGKRIARIAAVRGEGIEVVPRGEERAFLAPLPLAVLGASPALAETLGRWGVATAGAFAALPESGLASRLGPEGVRLWRLCRGEDDEPIVPRELPPIFEEGCDLDHEIVAMEGLLFLLRPVLERLVDRLSCRGHSCGGLTMRLSLEPAGEAILPVEVAAPTRDVPTLLALCRSLLERRPPGAPVRGLRVRAEAAGGRIEQLRLFGLPTVSPDRLATVVAKVAAIVGDDRLGSPAPEDSHVHEAFAMERFDPPPPAEEEAAPEGERHLALRLFRPPLPAEVRMAAGLPQAISARGVTGWVVSLAGPWRVDVGWHDRPLRRDGFDVELSDGAVYRLAHDLSQDRWFLLGRYD